MRGNKVWVKTKCCATCEYWGAMRQAKGSDVLCEDWGICSNRRTLSNYSKEKRYKDKCSKYKIWGVL